MSHCRAIFKINLSDPGSLVSEIYRQCASHKFLQAACSAFGSQAGFLDQHICTLSLRAEARVICWLEADQMFECIWKPVLLLRHAKVTSSCLCRWIETACVHCSSKDHCTSRVHVVGDEGHECCWCKVTWQDRCRIHFTPSALLSCGIA